ncbi:MAG: hypothetical protein U5R31_07645 [Acidimicrobiia bacterium]|nr:hypothetical protein [Acidimicrobiia bacterium]
MLLPPRTASDGTVVFSWASDDDTVNNPDTAPVPGVLRLGAPERSPGAATPTARPGPRASYRT